MSKNKFWYQGGPSLQIMKFLGPRGPLVLPSVGPSVRPSALKIWITYIQAYMPYELWKDSSNQPYGPRGSPWCPLDPWGSGLLQMIIWRIRPLANDHPEGLAPYKRSSVTPFTPITSPRIQIKSRGPFSHNLFLLLEFRASPQFQVHFKGHIKPKHRKSVWTEK